VSAWKISLFEPSLGAAEKQALMDVLDSGWLTMGERTAEFERRFAAMVGVPHAIAVNSATAALHMALTALDVGPGDEVICPSLTFVATANAVRYRGARPVFADIQSLDVWNVDSSTIEPMLSPRTRAIIVVHYAGYVCDMGPIRELARTNGLHLIEDVAHAPGATRDGIRAGALGDVGCFSFFSNKNMTTGEGGMATTASDDIAARLRRLRSHGMTTLTLDRHKGHSFTYDVVDLGYNYRMSEMNAALGLVQLERLQEWNTRRAHLVGVYRHLLGEVSGISAPFAAHPGQPAFHIMPVLLPKGLERAEVMRRMKEAGVQTSIHYPPVDTFTAYREAGLGPASHLRSTHEVTNRTITLPLYPGMSEADVATVVSALSQSLSLVSS
jgi:dTDP-4-amino-4,6-dideoxygalactose transaminase